ncbi:WD40-repeat protein (notchless protein), related protein [Ceratobasidium sp. AG-Ba]|nr:WD40-repeat protein (notchless protein), related protein [Ceratobasidium sp. AG-Ba]QRW06724.1 Vegetative incompatibility protein HET-E-1 [Ceratobasidium sp. AG-Ba]
MTSRQMARSNMDFRYRIHGIRFEPETSKHDIIAEIQADGTRLYKLPRIEKGQILEWKDLYAFCDVHDGSLICLQVTEVHTVRNRTGRAEHQVFRENSSDSVSMVCNLGGKSFMVHMRVMGKDATKQAYAEALAAAKAMNNKHQSIGKSSRAMGAFERIMNLNKILVDLDPTGGAEAAFWVCTKAWEFCLFEHLEAQEQQNVEMEDLLNSLGSILPSVDSVKKIANPNLRETLVEIQNLVEDASVYILSTSSRSRSERNIYKTLNPAPRGQLDAFVKRSQQLRQEFHERMMVQTLQSNEKKGQRDRLKELNPAQLASYNPSRCSGCMDGTRVGIIENLTGWVKEKGTEIRLAWVHGLAGLGKSSIMTSVCKLLDDQGLLVCSFFCRRDNAELRDARKILMTLVCELAQRWEAYGVAVSEVIADNVGLHSKHIQPLYDLLVTRPWMTISEEDRPSGTLAVVVDALDESRDAEVRLQLLSCLRNISHIMPFVKVIVASRPDDNIRSFFLDTDRSWYSEFNLLQYDAGQDIHRFVQHSLSSLSSVEGWPSDAAERLAERAGGLFIWARTACAYILAGLDRLKRLEQLTDRKHLVAIDKLYETILTDRDTAGDDESAEELRSYLGIIVAVSMRRALPIMVLSPLMGKQASRAAIQGVVDRLSSVLYIDQTFGGAIRISHPSFMDYLTDRARSKDLCVDLAEKNTMLANACLQTMRDELKFNICGLETSDRLNRDIPDLDARTQRAISPQLIYACEFWSSHLSEAPAGTLGPVLHSFLSSPGLMYWLEALSLLGKLSVAPPSLLRVAEWCTTNHLNDSYGMAQDAYRFVLAFYDPIATSTPHLYISALSMAPANSQISKRMREYFSNLPAFVDSINLEWTPCIRSISAGTAVHSVGMSPDDKHVVSGCLDGTVRVWDAETGESIIGPLRVHPYHVSTIAWSHDDSMIATGSEDATVRLWNSITGAALLGPLEGSRSAICVTFSGDDGLVASAFEDYTVRAWNTKSGSLVFEAASRAVYPAAIRFSMDGQRLMLNAGGRTIHRWDITTRNQVMAPENIPLADPAKSAFLTLDNNRTAYAYGALVALWDVNQELVFGPLLGHSDDVPSVTCSSSGNRIVSGSYDTTIRIWDVCALPSPMSPVDTAANLNRVHSLPSPASLATFSLDGRLIASAHLNDTIWVWDAQTGRVVLGPLESLSDSPESIAFTSGGRLVSCALSGGRLHAWDVSSGRLVHKMITQNDPGSIGAQVFSADGQLLVIVPKSQKHLVRIWNVEDGTVILEQSLGNLNPTMIAAFSPDNRNIAFISRDRTVHVWDVQTGRPLFETVTGHSKGIPTVLYSPDGLRIASGSFDATICIWNALTGKLMVTLHDMSGSDQGTLNIWDTTTGRMVSDHFLGYKGYSGSYAISPSNCMLYATDDGLLRLADLTPCLQPDIVVRGLPGTNIVALPENIGEGRLMVSTGQLARHLDGSMNGWVTGSDGKPLIWLPHELRQLDESYMRISHDGPQRHRIDFTRFVHGENWVKVKGE